MILEGFNEMKKKFLKVIDSEDNIYVDEKKNKIEIFIPKGENIGNKLIEIAVFESYKELKNYLKGIAVSLDFYLFAIVKDKNEKYTLYISLYSPLHGRRLNYEVSSGNFKDIIRLIDKFIKFLEKNYQDIESVHNKKLKSFVDKLIDVENRIRDAGFLIATYIKYLGIEEGFVNEVIKEGWGKIVLQLFVMYYLHRKGEELDIKDMQFNIFSYIGKRINPDGYEIWETFKLDYKKLKKLTSNLILLPEDVENLEKNGILLRNELFVRNKLSSLEWLKYLDLKNKLKFLRNSLGKKDETAFSISIKEFYEKFKDLGIFELFEIRKWYESGLIGDIMGGVYEGIKKIEERKKSGIYYTPRFIVEYIVDNILESYLKDRIEEITEKKYDSVEEFINSVNIDQLKKFYEELLNIKILDPACGTGHFLIYAMEKLASYYRKLGKRILEDNISDNFYVTIFVGGKRKKISLYALTKEDKDVFEFLIRQHFILKNNIFGVDIDTDAHLIAKSRFMVEVFKYYNRKLHDWFTIFPNIEMNIKEGNSLIGFASWNDVKNIDFSKGTLLDFLGNEKKGKIEEIIELMEKAKLSSSFADYEKHMKQVHEKLNELFIKYLNKKGIKIKPEELKNLKPFHWIVEFPIVFFDFENGKLKENPGFDIIVGNPPYVRQERLKREFEDVLGPDKYKEILIYVFKPSDKMYDYALYFSLRSLQLLKFRGYHSFVITNKWLRAGYGKSFRKYLKDNTSLLYIMDFLKFRAFQDATVDVMIYILKKAKPNRDHKIFYNIPENSEDLEYNGYFVFQSTLKDDVWNFVDERTLEIKEWIEKVGVPLKELDIKIFYGIKTGFNEAFIIDDETRKKLIEEDAKSEELIRPLLRGRDIGRYYVEWDKRWIIVIPAGFTKRLFKKDLPLKDAEELFKKEYPSIYKHFELFKYKKGKGKGLVDRDDQGDYWWELRPCDYYDEFEKPKIIWQEISVNSRFSLDFGIFYIPNNAYMMINASKIYLIILNSTLIEEIFKQISQFLSKGYRHTKQYIEKIPIRLPNNIKPYEILADYLLFLNAKEDWREKYKELINFFDKKIIDSLIYELYFKEKLYNEDNEYLLEAVSKHLKPINYDRWVELYWRKKIYNELSQKEEKEFKELEEKNLKTVLEVVKRLYRDKEIEKWVKIIKSHEWINVIEK